MHFSHDQADGVHRRTLNFIISPEATDGCGSNVCNCSQSSLFTTFLNDVFVMWRLFIEIITKALSRCQGFAYITVSRIKHGIVGPQTHHPILYLASV